MRKQKYLPDISKHLLLKNNTHHENCEKTIKTRLSKHSYMFT